MVTRQGGTLKGTVLINNGQGFGDNNWAAKVEITKPVSRPWVELIYNKPVLSQAERSESSLGTEMSNAHTYFPLDEEREVKLKVHKMVGGVEVPTDENDFIKVTVEPSTAVEGLPITVPFTSSVFKVKSIDAAQSFKFRYEFVEKNAKGGEQEAQSFKVELAMDYDRDGNINDTDFTTADDKKTYLFWVNDDRDKITGSYTMMKRERL